MRSASADFTLALACRAPRTLIDPIVASASSGVTSGCDTGKPNHLDMQRLAGGFDRLEIRAAVVAQPEFERVPDDQFLDRVRVCGELIADGGADEVGAVGVEALLHQQVDPPEVDIAEIDRDLLGFVPPCRAAW